ncbi:ribonuclease S-5 [Pyrus x bretschneideri]|uniref:S22-RNase n=10 Tax=Maleae TaxID=721813 RepID=A6NAH0_9ROSA|nr:ribonuclease S-5 [Pyrus x bretschneideri]ABR23521.1 S22-RNase [Pyrus sinkiangensis]AOS95460.1 S22-RNase [Pyrus sinkiangensis]BAE92268.1 Sh-RNase [Pyrus communis]
MGITGMIYMVTMVFSLLVSILSSSTVGFDYFQFTQQYQPAACNSNPTPCKDPTDKLFTVHGLWPSNKIGGDPEYCKIRNPRKRAKKLEPQLEIIWPNVLDRTNHTGFWSRQWKKHGACGYPTIQNENDYFETVIKMYITEKQNVSRILSNAKIEPDGKSRALVDIENAIRNGTNNKLPKLKCQKKTRVTELVEITLCSDKNRAHFIDCPNPFLPGSPYLCPNNSIHY